MSRDTARNVHHAVEGGHPGQADRTVSRHRRSVAPVACARIVHLHHTRGLLGGTGERVVVADGVDLLTHHGTAMVLLLLLHLLGGRFPRVVRDIKDINGLGHRLVTRLRGIDINSPSDQEHLVRGRKVSGACSGAKGRQPVARGGRPRHRWTVERGEPRGRLVGQIRKRKTALRGEVRFRHDRLKRLLFRQLRFIEGAVGDQRQPSGCAHHEHNSEGRPRDGWPCSHGLGRLLRVV